MKKRVTCILMAAVTAALVVLFAGTVTASASEHKTVRVGYIVAQGYQEGLEGEYKTGFGYEYLQKIKNYTGWEYEYVYGNFSDLLKALQEGDIDIMGNITKTPDRMNDFDFGFYPEGSENYYLTVQASNSRIDRDRIGTLSGKTVGINAGSVQVDLFRNWLAGQNIRDVVIVEYEDAIERTSDFNNGIIDAVVTITIPSGEHWMNVCSIGESEYYFACNRKKPWIKEELDAAQRTILEITPNYNTHLYNKYHHDSNDVSIALSTVERNWIEEHPVLKVGYLVDMLPYCGKNSKGQMEGVFKDFFDELGKAYSLQIDYSGYDDFKLLLDALNTGTIDVIIPVYCDFWTAEKLGIALADELISTSVSLMSYEDYSELEYNKIALCDNLFFQPYYVYAHYPDAEYIYYDDFEDCVSAVLKREVDCTFYNSDLLQVKMHSLKDLLKVELRNMRTDDRVSMAVRVGDIELISILNRAVANTTEAAIGNGMVTYAHQAGSDEISVSRFFKEYGVEILTIVALVMLLFIVELMYAYRRSVMQKQSLSEQKQLAEHQAQLLKEALEKYDKADTERRTDFLTGLWNRQDMFEMLEKAVAGETPEIKAVFMMDIDNFKNLNDTYGHERGDFVLSTIGKALRVYSIDNKLSCYRYGGEEMLCFSYEGGKEPEVIAEELLQLIRNLKIERKDSPLKIVTVSLGYTTTNSRYEKMIDFADKAMYESKNNGKNRATSYESMNVKSNSKKR